MIFRGIFLKLTNFVGIFWPENFMQSYLMKATKKSVTLREHSCVYSAMVTEYHNWIKTFLSCYEMFITE